MAFMCQAIVDEGGLQAPLAEQYEGSMTSLAAMLSLAMAVVTGRAES